MRLRRVKCPRNESVAATAIPAACGLRVKNRGTAILTIDPNGSDLVNGTSTIALYPNQWAELTRRGSGFDAIGNFGAPPLFKTGTGTLAAGALAVTFSPQFPNGILDAHAEQYPVASPATIAVMGLSTLAVTGFTLTGPVGSTAAVRWRAWGY